MSDEATSWRDTLLCGGVLTVAAVLIDLGTIHSWHHGDSLLPSLISTLQPTFYYWEQNRYGMLTAWLAQPFVDPFVNLLVQNGITIWAGLACFPLAAKFFGIPYPRISGLFAAIIYVALAPEMMQWVFLSTFNVFAVSLACGLAALNIQASTHGNRWWRLLLAMVFMLVGSWVNSALGLLLAPLVLVMPLLRHHCGDVETVHDHKPQRWKQWLQPDVVVQTVFGLSLCTFGIISAMALQRTTPYRTTWVVLPPVEQWPKQFELAWNTLIQETNPKWWFVALLFYAVIVVVWVPRSQAGDRRRALFLPVAVLLACSVYMAAMLILFAGRWRYTAPALMLLHTATLCTVMPILDNFIYDRRRQIFALRAFIALVAAIVFTWGWPNPMRAKTQIMQAHDQAVAACIDQGCTHIAGDYWKVWPTVFCANQTYADNDLERRLWGVSFRSEPTRVYWDTIPMNERRVATFKDDPEAEIYLRKVLTKPVKHFTGNNIDVWINQP